MSQYSRAALSRQRLRISPQSYDFIFIPANFPHTISSAVIWQPQIFVIFDVVLG